MRRSIVLAVLLLILGCASTREIPARLYNLDTAEIIEARFLFSGNTSGIVEFTTATGEHFQGEYSAVPSGTISWGTIYGSIYSETTKSKKIHGSAVAVSNMKTIVECEYVSNSSRINPQGYGACKDNRGKRYKLIF